MKLIIVASLIILMIWYSYQFYIVYRITEKYHKQVEEMIKRNHKDDENWEDINFYGGL